MYWISSHWLRQNCQTKYNIGAACLTFLMYFFRCIILVVFWIKILELVIQILLLKFWAFYWELICFIWIKLQIKLFCFNSHTNVSGPSNFVLSLRIYSDESCLLNHSACKLKPEPPAQPILLLHFIRHNYIRFHLQLYYTFDKLFLYPIMHHIYESK